MPICFIPRDIDLTHCRRSLQAESQPPGGPCCPSQLMCPPRLHPIKPTEMREPVSVVVTPTAIPDPQRRATRERAFEGWSYSLRGLNRGSVSWVLSQNTVDRSHVISPVSHAEPLDSLFRGMPGRLWPLHFTNYRAASSPNFRQLSK